MKEQVTIGNTVYDLVSDYKQDEVLRESFFDLAEEIFHINFKEWYEAGLWGERYKPYSLVHNGGIVANVSVSQSDFIFRGKKKSWIQLGCVAVDKDYRKQGLARFLIEYVLKQYEESSEGIFLFGNDRVLDFYPKFGFYKTKEYQYTKKIIDERALIKSRLNSYNYSNAKIVYRKEEQLERNYYYRKLDCASQKDINLVVEKTRGYYREEAFAALDNTSLVMFYWQDLFADSLYYIEALDTVVIFDTEKDKLYIHEVFGEAELGEIISTLIKDNVKEVILGFVPKEQGEYEISSFNKKDTTLFVSKKEMKELIEGEKLMFPVLSHT